MNKLDIRNLRLAEFGHNLNKTRQSLSDVILQEGDGPTVIPTLAKKITSELAEVRMVVPGDCPAMAGMNIQVSGKLVTQLLLLSNLKAWGMSAPSLMRAQLCLHGSCYYVLTLLAAA